MGIKYLTHLRCVNNVFSYPSFLVHVKSFNRHLSAFQLRGTLYCIRLVPHRYSAFQISRLLSSKDRFMKNTKLDINDIQHDPETRSLIREITEHFQDTFDAPLTETPAESISSEETTSETPKVSPLISSKFVPFEKDVEQDIHQEHHKAGSHLHQSRDYNQQIDYERGVEGVFDIGQLVEILKLENVQDICVIKVPPELLYAEYLVIVSGRSHRHVSAVAEYIKKLYKKIKNDKEAFIIIQGEGSKNWLAIDMGNIVLHIFMPEVRAKYDIETLWSVGEKYDDLCQKPPADLSSKLQSYLEFMNEAKPLNSGSS